jgi:hypothetical protein
MLYNSQEPTFTPTPTPTPTTTSTPGFENKVLKEIYYNCTECNSLIEILSINEKENTIEFICSNQHKKLMPIKEFLDKMMDNDNVDINKDICQIHKNQYMSFCFDCKKHLCKDCLKTREHIYHNKNNIIEIQPIKTELKIIKKIVKYYDDKLEKLKNKKFLIKKRLNSFLDKCKTDIDNILQKEIFSSETKKKLELENNKIKFSSDIKKIREKYEREIKNLKEIFNKNEIIIDNKYQIKKEKLELYYKYKFLLYQNKCDDILRKVSFDKNIENLTNLKRLNELVYNTYNLYNNNYYNSKNINNIIISLHQNNIHFKSFIQNESSETDYEIILKSLFKNVKKEVTQRNINDENFDSNQYFSQLEDFEKQKLLLERKLNEKIIEFKKKENDYQSQIAKLKNNIDENKFLMNSSLSSSNEKKEYKEGRYIGSIIDGKREGIGIFIYVNGKRYEGEWKNDKIDGRGIMFYKNGDKYDGYFANNKKEGKGTYYYNNGNTYVGDWKNDKKGGKGIFYGKEGQRKMGDYFEGKPIGKHVILHVNGEVEIKE